MAKKILLNEKKSNPIYSITTIKKAFSFLNGVRCFWVTRYCTVSYPSRLQTATKESYHILTNEPHEDAIEKAGYEILQEDGALPLIAKLMKE